MCGGACLSGGEEESESIADRKPDGGAEGRSEKTLAGPVLGVGGGCYDVVCIMPIRSERFVVHAIGPAVKGSDKRQKSKQSERVVIDVHCCKRAAAVSH